MTQAINFDTVETLSKAFTDYAQTLPNSDRIRLAAHCLFLANCVQQTADITQDNLWHAREETMLFDEVDKDDPMDPGYHLHNMLENLGDELNGLARIMDGEEA